MPQAGGDGGMLRCDPSRRRRIAQPMVSRADKLSYLKLPSFRHIVERVQWNRLSEAKDACRA